MKDKTKKGFRNYESTSEQVKKTYQKMQENQSLTFFKRMKKKYGSANGLTDNNGQKIRERFVDVFSVLDHIIDESDPDTGLPQIYHAYQTGEALRKYCDVNHPCQLRKDIWVKDLFSEEEWNRLPLSYQQTFSCYLHELFPQIQDWSWLPVIGFLHDLGKVMASEKWGALPQWAVVGDTFPLGVPFASANVFYDEGFFKKNPDLNVTEEAGIHHMGFEKQTMSWGHDEYCYTVLNRTAHHLPPEALYIIRFHSFYPWHTPRGGERGYENLASEVDWLRLPLLKLFQKSDLYSKTVDLPDVKELKTYYMDLIKKFIPGRFTDHYDLRPAKILW